MNRHSRFAPFASPRCWLIGAGLVLSTALAAQTTGGELLRSTPEEQGVDSEPLVRMLMAVRNQNLALHSFLLLRNDRLVAEVYFTPYTSTIRHAMYSVTKSFTSAAFGIALGEGYFTSVDERVVDLLGSTTPAASDTNLQRMTLRHLLTMSTGHTTDSTSAITATTDWVRAFLELPVPAAPGSLFLYDSGASCMVSAAIQRRTGQTTAAYADQHLLRPLGIVNYTWDSGPNNLTIGGWGLSLLPVDMAKFGLLYLHHGQWNGRPLIPANWVAECSRRQMDNGTSGFWGSGYGYQFWLNDFGGYRADGAQGQLIFVLPDYGAVAVFTAGLANAAPEAELMNAYVLPALRPATALIPNPLANALLGEFSTAAGSISTASGRPVFTALPTAQTVIANHAVTLNAAATGAAPRRFQWLKDGIPVEGATADTLTLSSPTVADTGEYTVNVSNSAGNVTSLATTLDVHAPPTVLTAPVPLQVAAGREALFQVGAGGGDLTFTWRRDGIALPAGDSPTLRLPSVSAGDAGRYSVVIRNPRGTVVTEPVALTVVPPDDPPRLINLSARTRAGAGDQTLIVGLVVQGADPAHGLPVLLRGVGPALTDFGVTTAMVDPATRLFTGVTPIGGNADWRGNALLADVAARVGAFPLRGASTDSALLRTLPTGVYSMHVTSSQPGANSEVALAECYDASGGATATGPRLINLSARATVTPDEGTLIAGFVIAGSGPLRVLLRGVGPTLAQFGVSSRLADPELHLYSDRTVIAQNDNWGNDDALRATFSQVGAFALPADSTDAALSLSLAPGIYTAHVSGKNGAIGVALVEVYAVP